MSVQMNIDPRKPSDNIVFDTMSADGSGQRDIARAKARIS